MPKTSHLLVLCASLCAVVGLWAAPAAALASVILSDDFDAYSDGALTGQGDWTNLSWSCDVASGKVVCDGTTWGDNNKSGVSLSSGDMTARIKFVAPADPVNEQLGWFQLRPTAGQLSIGIYFYYSNDHPGQIGATGGNYSPEDTVYFSIGDWHTVRFTWADGSFSAYIDDILFFTDVSSYDWGGVWFALRPYSQKNWEMWIDDIGAGAPPPISGYAPILTPTSPPRNTETIVDFEAGFEVSGNVQIPTSNSNIYTDLVLTFRAPDSFLPAETYVIDIGELTSGQSYNYSATTTVPIISSGDNFFKVGYTILGSPYGGSFLNPPINEELLAFDNTWVKDSADDAPDYLITPSIKPDQPALEDCSAYSGADKIFCEFRNFVVGAFLPSDSALNQIGATMSALQNKFPVNYARAVGDTFSDISESVNDGATISFNLLGASGAVDTSIFTADLGDGITMGATIKTIITLLVLTVFAFWAVGYMHRILR